MGLLPGQMGRLVKGIGKLCVLAFMVLYVISPIDLLPEAIFGPLGFIDDLVVIVFGSSFIGFDFFKTAKKTRTSFQETKK